MNLEEDWGILRPSGDSPIVSVEKDALKRAMEVAAIKTQVDLSQKLQAQEGTVNVQEIVGLGMKMFWLNLTAELKAIDLAGMIESILMMQGLPADDLKTFLRAIPIGVIKRITESPFGETGKGIHALMALELMVRSNQENDYTLTGILSGGIEVAVTPRRASGRLTFTLEESFSLSTPQGVESTEPQGREDTPV